jgi:hypothetical protein
MLKRCRSWPADDRMLLAVGKFEPDNQDAADAKLSSVVTRHFLTNRFVADPREIYQPSGQ